MSKIRFNYPFLYVIFAIIVFFALGNTGIIFYGLFIVAISLEHIADAIREKE